MAAWVWLAVTGDTVTKWNCRRITKGTSLAEVEAIFGRPADKVAESSPSAVQPEDHHLGPFTVRVWVARANDRDFAYFMFGADDKVVGGGWGGERPILWYERFARRLGL